MMPEGKEVERIWPFLCANNKTIRRIFSQFMLSIKVSQHFFFCHKSCTLPSPRNLNANTNFTKQDIFLFGNSHCFLIVFSNSLEKVKKSNHKFFPILCLKENKAPRLLHVNALNKKNCSYRCHISLEGA